MVPSRNRFPSRLTLQIKHVLPEIIELRFVEGCGQHSVDAVFQIFERRAQGGDDGVVGYAEVGDRAQGLWGRGVSSGDTCWGRGKEGNR